MWSFRRRTNGSVPAEVSEYYQAEKRDRLGMAWLLSVVTFVVTVLVVLGLFFGGRWAYRKLANRSKAPKATTTQQKSNTGSSSNTNQQKQSSGNSSNTPAKPSPAPTPAPQPKPAPTPTPQPASTPPPATTAAADASLPHTGPNSVVIFALTVMGGYLLHLVITKARQQRDS